MPQKTIQTVYRINVSAKAAASAGGTKFNTSENEFTGIGGSCFEPFSGSCEFESLRKDHYTMTYIKSQA
jgi:hypothetical protein